MGDDRRLALQLQNVAPRWMRLLESRAQPAMNTAVTATVVTITDGREDPSPHRSSTGAGYQPGSRPAQRHDAARLAGLLAELASHRVDVDVDGLRRNPPVLVPHVVDECFAA
jgi:hypothetical protein